jgi:hypothetical protein
MGEGEMKEILSIHPCGTSRVLLYALKSYDMGPSRSTSHARGRCAALKNPSPWPGFEPATFGYSGQHTNHYTTKATFISSLIFKSSSQQQFNTLRTIGSCAARSRKRGNRHSDCA